MPDPQVRAWRLLLTVRARLVDDLDAEMRQATGLPLAWYEVLLLLREGGGRLRMYELADSLLLSRSAATRFVDRLETRGLVSRHPSEEDRRGTVVALTPAGEEAFAAAAPLHLRGIRARFAAHVGDAEAEAMIAALERVLAAREGG